MILSGAHLMTRLPTDTSNSVLGDQTSEQVNSQLDDSYLDNSELDNSQFAINTTNLPPLKFQAQIANDSNAVIIDIREPHEIAQGKIQGALELDFYNPEFPQQLSKLDKNKNYYIYCNSGNRTSQTIPLMQSLGFTNVYQLQTGIQGWYQHSLQTCTNC